LSTAKENNLKKKTDSKIMARSVVFGTNTSFSMAMKYFHSTGNYLLSWSIKINLCPRMPTGDKILSIEGGTLSLRLRLKNKGWRFFKGKIENCGRKWVPRRKNDYTVIYRNSQQ
jgi:hypothetical protein